MSTKRKLFILLIPLFLVATIGFGMTATAKAVEFDEDGFIGADEVIDDDLFIGADTVEINGTINGDVFAAGSIVKVNGNVNGSLVTGAQAVLVNGEVTGSIYSGSSTFTLGSDARVGRNLYYGGFNLSAEPGSIVGRDLLVGAYQALLSGEIGRDVRAGTGALEVSDFVLLFNQNDGSATDVSISSLKQEDDTDEGSASDLVGGDTIYAIDGHFMEPKKSTSCDDECWIVKGDVFDVTLKYD